MSIETTHPQPPTQFLAVEQGRLGYDVAGTGSLIVLVPGLGDLRAGYRFLAPALRDAGYRVATTDVRGHGDSDATFADYGDVPTAEDIRALIEELGGGPAVVVGNSFSAGAAVLLAADHPGLVSALVLLGPFVRNPAVHPALTALLRLALVPAWAATTWKYYLPRLYAGRKPVDFDAYRASVIASVRRPGRAAALSRTARTDHAPVEARLSDVSAPALIVMGEEDPDFADPREEAQWIGNRLHGEVVVVPEAGHYPQSQQPDVTAGAILGFLSALAHRA